MDYILRGIEPSLWKRIKMRCLDEGITVKALLFRLLKAWLKEKDREKEKP